MKKLAMAAVAALAMTSAFATGPTTGANTLWGQEGGSLDGATTVNGKALNGGYSPGNDKLNWLNQGGAATYSAVYSWDNSAWVAVDESGDSSIDVEADIEMYYSDSIQGNKMYFHLGNLFAATAAQKTAYVTQQVQTNHPMYVGWKFPSSKNETDMERDSLGNLTGVINKAMTGTLDVGGRNMQTVLEGQSGYVAPEGRSFPIKITRSVDAGVTYVAPVSFGNGAHNTISNTLWWAPPVAGGNFNYIYKVELMPGSHQADGNYHLDPTKVVVPEL